MDARERLRLYLEQRRELGESELVLDGLAVDDVMAMLGAREIAKPPRGVRSPVSAMTPPPSAAPPIAESTTARASEQPSITLPPAPDPRFEVTAGSNWRQTLRQADAANADPHESTPGKLPANSATPRAAILPVWVAALGLPVGLSASVSGSHGLAGASPAASLTELADMVRACTGCALHATARHAVPGEGDAQAELVCVGEAPGAHEDEQGRPFVGEAGQLLTKILAAIHMPRESVYICNVLKHRPPANRDPLPDEVAACQPFLTRQLELVNPRVILALGRFAAQTLLGTTTSLGQLRGQVHEYRGIPVIVTYHPAALLRNEAWKRPTWDDVKLARIILDASRTANPRADDGRSDR